eukprot:TRINITY_DN108283_c0_g1_i1.p1 TRINITY_DN108283_c0_g1~~TRINITY_DN108283_c0_g1_i1.p1  ORF type:complete len:857 (-),score=168.93 TRINITY_DN108283_c0_g1_i1:119-2689(-)
MVGHRLVYSLTLLVQVVCHSDAPEFTQLRGARRGQSKDQQSQPNGSGECAIDSAPHWSMRNGSVRVAMDLQEAQACINELVGPATHAKQTVTALANYFESFYTFARIAADPMADNYSFATEFEDAGLGIFGGEGGGAPPELSKVDLIGGLNELAASIPDSGDFPVAQWVGPVNDLFNSLRDAHVWWDVGSSEPLKLLNKAFTLALFSNNTLVQLRVSTFADEIMPDSTSTPIFEDADGNTVESVDGDQPMDWLLKNLVEVSTFPDLAYKSTGARMNALLNSLRRGVAFYLGSLGTLSALSPDPILVNLTDGRNGSSLEASWQWRVIVLQSETVDNDTCNFTCMVGNVKAAISSQSPGDAKSITEADLFLSQSWESEPIRTLSKARPAERWLDPGRFLVEATAENTSATVPAASKSTPEGLFTWLLEPTDATDTYGYFAFRTGDDGMEYGIFKYTTFDLEPRAPAGFTEEDDGTLKHTLTLLKESWQEFTREAQSRGTTRLLVDMVGNGGGWTPLAWQFVQFMHPDLPFSATCGVNNRPVPAVFEKWNSINLVSLFEFATLEGLQQQRINELENNPAAAHAVSANLASLLKASQDLDVATDDELQQLANATGLLDTLGLLTDRLMADANPFAAEGNLPLLQSYKHTETQSRGGTPRKFTAKFRQCPSSPSGNLTNPFVDIIFVSDGLCGSSCYLASGTTWALAKKYGNRKVRFATFGGIGGSLYEARQTLSPTSFPGGNVQGSGATAVFKPILKSVMIQLAVAQIMGDVRLSADLGEVWDDMVNMTPFYSSKLPQFTQSEAFQWAFGPDSPPAEYVFVPTDIYLPAWFSDLSGANPASWDMNQLDKLYIAAAKAFTK